MKIYWSYKYVPELAALSPRERRAVVRSCFWRFTRHWQCWLALAAYLVCGLVGVLVGALLEFAVGLPPAVHFVCVVLGACVGAIIWCQVVLEQLRPDFRQYLERRLV
jgi:hypothetical protein